MARLGALSFAVVAVRIAGTAGTFLYTLLVARTMNPEDVGIVWAIWSGSILAATLTTLNIGSGAVREIAGARANGDDHVAAGFIVASRRILMVTSPFVVAGLLAAGWWRSPDGTTGHPVAYALAAAAVPVLGWVSTNAAVATALHQPLRSQVPRELVRPLIFLAVFAVVWLLQARPSVEFVVALFFVSIALAAIFQYLMLRRFFDFMASVRPDTSRWRDWVASGLYLAPMLLLSEYLKDVIILVSALAVDAGGVGQLAIALSLVNLLNFGIVSVDIAFSPKLAAALSGNHAERAAHLLAVSNLLKCAPVVLGSILLALLIRPILSLFGMHYLGAANATIWFLLIPLSRAVFGNSTLIMQVKGHRAEIFWSSLLGIAAMSGAILVFGAAYGVDAAAASAGIVFAAAQFVRLLACRHATGVDTSLFGTARHFLAHVKRRSEG